MNKYSVHIYFDFYFVSFLYSPFLFSPPNILIQIRVAPQRPLLLRCAVRVEVVELATGEPLGAGPLAVCFLDGSLDLHFGLPLLYPQYRHAPLAPQSWSRRLDFALRRRWRWRGLGAAYTMRILKFQPAFFTLAQSQSEGTRRRRTSLDVCTSKLGQGRDPVDFQPARGRGISTTGPTA